VAAATVAARFGMECVVYMGSEDIERQAQNVFRMKLLGADVVPVESGSKTLKDALNEAMRDWVTNVENTFYIIGTVAGPHPYPMMVRDFQTVIGKECLWQMPELCGRQPDFVIACVGGGSNAMGIFYPYLAQEGVKLIGVEAAGEGIATGRHSASLTAGRAGVLHGNRTYLLRDANGRSSDAFGVGGLIIRRQPQHAATQRPSALSFIHDEALAAFGDCHIEGIIPALGRRTRSPRNATRGDTAARKGAAGQSPGRGDGT
jgi:tryptophan synthase beta chain